MANLKTILVFLHIFSQNLYSSESAGTIIPFYIYPVTKSDGSHTWDEFLSIYDSVEVEPSVETWLIVNVNSGPGSSKNSDYEKAIPRLHEKGIKTLGYVSTNYGNRSEFQVRRDVNNWLSWYAPHGIFFDEMSNENNRNKIRYYRRNTNYVRSQGFEKVVGNPGTSTPDSYAEMVDTLITYEKNGLPLEGEYNELKNRQRNHPLDKWAMIPYNVSQVNFESENSSKKGKETFGYIYITNDILPNPWDTIPPYLSQLYEYLR